MMNTIQAETSVAAQRITKTRGERRSWSTTLVAPDGTVMTVLLAKRKDNTFKVTCLIGRGKGIKKSRGASSLHPDEKAARAAFGKLGAAAEAKGWLRREPRRIEAKPDQFDIDHIPAPPKKGKK